MSENGLAGLPGKVIASDGTSVAYYRYGSGLPLVIVHGAGGDHTNWASVIALLERFMTIYAVERRGRGASGDAESYAIEREYEDVNAVLDSIGRPVDLLGHSYGAICALGAALDATHLRKLILYEHPSAGGNIVPEGAVSELETLLEQNDLEGVYVSFSSKVAQMTPEEIALVQADPTWPSILATASTVPREVRAAEEYRFDPRQYRELNIPTLLLLGTDSPDYFKPATEAIDAALPDSKIVLLPGQGHVAQRAAPELVAEGILKFLKIRH